MNNQPKAIKQTLLVTLLALSLFCLPTISKAQTGFNHVALCSTNLKESNTFYSAVLNLKVIPNPFKDTVHTWYQIAPTATMHVIQGDCPRVAHNRGEHLCFSVPSVTDFVAKLNSLKVAYCNWKGVPNQVEHLVDGVSQVYFTDPDGFWIEVNDAK